VSNTIEQILRKNYDAFAQGNADPLMASLADDVQWRVSGGSPLAGDYTGKTEVLGFFGKMMQLYGQTLKLQVVDVLASNKHGVVLTQEESRYNGKTLSFRSVHVWEVENEKLAKIQRLLRRRLSQVLAASRVNLVMYWWPVLLGRLFISVGRRAAHLANRRLSFAWLAG
jgi:ketosteroid isomerase-like protein